MRSNSIDPMATVRRAFGLMAGLLMMAAAASAQAQQAEPGQWRIGASTGAYVPFSALIRAADLADTRLTAGPAFSLEPQYVVSDLVSVYASGLVAFPSIQRGSSIRPAAVGPSDQVMLAVGTGGVMFTGSNWLGDHMQPTFRLGGGFKWYFFDLSGAEDQFRPTGELGLGLRGIGVGAIEATAELRYLLSSFDQGKLPTRGIAVQDQRQNDLMFAIGMAIRH